VSLDARKRLGISVKGAGVPTQDQLAAINQFTLKDMTADELYVRTFVLAHSFIDRDNEVFDESLLADFARTIPGKGIFVEGHPTSWGGDQGPPEGKWFGAKTQTMTPDEARAILRDPTLQLPPDRNMATLLYADVYFVKTSENAALLTKMDAGIGIDVSVGFGANTRVPLTDAQGRELQAMRLMGPGEAYEGSLVWLGAQPGARAIKGKKSNSHEDRSMDPQNKDLQQQLDTANTTIKGLEPHKNFREALKSALGADHAALADNPAQLAALAVAGKSYRATMIDDLIRFDRQKGAVGDKPEDVAAAKAAYEAFELSSLKTLHGIAEKSAKGGGAGITGTDPNNTGAQPAVVDSKAALPKDSPLNNALI